MIWLKSEVSGMMAWWRCCIGIVPLLAAWCLVAAADSITVDGTIYEGVYVREGGLMYYVEIPSEGRVLSVAKARVDPSSVILTADAAQREALHAAWEAHRMPSKAMSGVASSSAQETALEGFDDTRPGPAAEYGERASSTAASGETTGRVSLKDVPLREALDAVLRPLNLDYSIEGDVIRIGRPDKLRTESFEDLEARVYSLKGAGMDDTLPKVVLRGNASSRAAAGASVYGSGSYGSVQTRGQSYGRMPSGGSRVFGGRYGGTGGGTSLRSYGNGGRGYGYNARGGYGVGGGYPSAGAPRGGGYGGPVPQFSNISDLFSTIDDRSVGETPAVIGP